MLKSFGRDCSFVFGLLLLSSLIIVQDSHAFRRNAAEPTTDEPIVIVGRRMTDLIELPDMLVHVQQQSLPEYEDRGLNGQGQCKELSKRVRRLNRTIKLVSEVGSSGNSLRINALFGVRDGVYGTYALEIAVYDSNGEEVSGTNTAVNNNYSSASNMFNFSFIAEQFIDGGHTFTGFNDVFGIPDSISAQEYSNILGDALQSAIDGLLEQKSQAEEDYNNSGCGAL